MQKFKLRRAIKPNMPILSEILPTDDDAPRCTPTIYNNANQLFTLIPTYFEPYGGLLFVRNIQFHLLQGNCKLVGARGILRAASYAPQAGYHLLRRAPFGKSRHPLRIAMTAAGKRHRLYHSVFDFNIYRTRTCAGCSIMVFHNLTYFLFSQIYEISFKTSPI